MIRARLYALLRIGLSALALGPFAIGEAEAQLAVIDPLNLIETALTAARTLEQINNQVVQITNQVRQLENEARNLARLGESLAPELIARLREMDGLLNEARGLALAVNQTRSALETLYTGDYRGTDVATRAQFATRQIDNARGALQTSLLVQAQTTEQLRSDETTLQALAAASANATGALSSQQATNELLAFQAEQSMRLQALLVADSRAEALERAREMEMRAQGRTEHAHFFGSAQNAYAGAKPWN